MTGYQLHPEARTDLDQIWDYIAAENVSAADRSPRTMAAILRGGRTGRLQQGGMLTSKRSDISLPPGRVSLEIRDRARYLL
jgi:plasmid stabilization system protein ParE